MDRCQNEHVERDAEDCREPAGALVRFHRGEARLCRRHAFAWLDLADVEADDGVDVEAWGDEGEGA